MRIFPKNVIQILFLIATSLSFLSNDIPKEIDLPIKTHSILVDSQEKVLEFDNTPLQNFYFGLSQQKREGILGDQKTTGPPNPARDLCTVSQSSFVRDTSKDQLIENQPPALNLRQPISWFRYGDGSYLVYRLDPNSPVFCAQFTKYGIRQTFWKLGDVFNGVTNINIFRDKADIIGPTGKVQAISYIYAPQRTFIYHEMTETGQTYRVRKYTADIDLNAIDMLAFQKHVYVVSLERIFKFQINEDQMRKVDELKFKNQGEYQSIMLTEGRVFLYIKRIESESGEQLFSLYAQDDFKDIANGRQQLVGNGIIGMLGGNQQYVFQVYDALRGGVSYKYLANPRAKHFYSLNFVDIPGLDQKFDNVVILKNRFHFYNLNDRNHVMYLRDTLKGLIRFNSNSPILGVVYQYQDQPIDKDRFVLISDTQKTIIVGKEKKVVLEGKLSIVPTTLSKPKIVCNTETATPGFVTKFTASSAKFRHIVTIKVVSQKSMVRNDIRIIDIMWGIVVGSCIVIMSYFCLLYEKVRIEHDRIMTTQIGQTEKVAGRQDQVSLDRESLEDSEDNAIQFGDEDSDDNSFNSLGVHDINL